MKVGLTGLNMGAATDPVVARDVAQAAEALGYDSLWVGDHPVLPNPPRAGSPFPPGFAFAAPLVTLGVLCGITSHVRLATGVLLLPQRNPVHLAKEIATLDRLSGGRMLVGIGAGYLESEFAAVGVPMAGRGRRVDEALAIMRELWSSPAPRWSMAGVEVSGVECLPHPTQPAGPPIVVGGHSPAAFDRAASSADGWLGWFLSPDQVGRRVERIRERPRSPERAQVEISVMPAVRATPQTAAAYRAGGVDRLVVTPPATADAEAILRFVERNSPAALEVG